MRNYHTTTVQGTEILALENSPAAYTTIKVTKEQAEVLGIKSGPRGKSLFGRIAQHSVVVDGKLTGQVVEIATVGTVSIVL